MMFQLKNYEEDNYEKQSFISNNRLRSFNGRLWQRSSEEHLEYAHSEEYLRAVMEKSGFGDIRFTADCPQGNMGRVFVTAKRKGNKSD